MNPRSFEYHAPTSVKEAVALLKKYEGDAKLLAGGQSLIPLMKLRVAAPAHLIDINRIGSLEYVRREDGHFAIGSLTRMADIEESEALRKACVILPECAAQIADPLVRNLGTVGGNVSHADPANDMPAVMVAAGAEMMAVGPRGQRIIPAREFFLDTFTTALREDELLTEIRVPVARYTDGAYLKLERQAGDFGIVGAAVVVRLSADGECAACGIGLAGAGPAVVEAKRAEATVVGSRLDGQAIERACALAAEESSPIGDLRGTERYKREMVKVMTRRSMTLALKRARSRLA